MNLNIKEINLIFQEAIRTYHIKNDVNQSFENLYNEQKTLNSFLYKKCWIDTVQWHLEDIIRDPEINPEKALEIKRKIDKSNQERTDLVELIDDYILNEFKHIKLSPGARINTESPGWAIDRLSILNLKLYHWQEEVDRKDATDEHIKKAKSKLEILQNQYDFLCKAIEMLFNDLQAGTVYAPTFKQMKMYNDPETNPILRASKTKQNE